MAEKTGKHTYRIGGPVVIADPDDPHFQYWGSEASQAFGRAIFHLERYRRTFFDRRLAAHGVSSAHYPLLAMLWEGHDGDTLSTLAEELHVDPATVTRGAQRLQELGLIERATSKRDARAVRIRLTETGWDLAKVGREASRDWNAIVAGDWSPRRRNEILHAIQTMLIRVDEAAEHGLI